MSLRLAGAALWSLVLLTSCLALPSILQKLKYPKKNHWLWILGIAILARFVPHLLVSAGANYDIESFKILADLFEKGEDIYSSPLAEGRHPYLPLLIYWVSLAGKLSTSINQPFEIIYRLLRIAADVGICLLILLLIKGNNNHRAFEGALRYAVNPIAVFVSAYHGQFDSVVLLFILLAVSAVSYSAWKTGIWMGLAILTKSWPVLALPSILISFHSMRKKILILFLVVLISSIGVGLYALVFKSDVTLILSIALSYNRGVGVWGYTYFLHLVSILKQELEFIFSWTIKNGRFLTLIGLVFVWFWRARHETPSAGILTILVSFLALTHAFAIQYLVWLIPFAIIDHKKNWLNIYTVTAYIYMVLVYFTLILTPSITRVMPLPQADWFIIMPAALPVWVVTILWMIDRLKDSRSTVITLTIN